MDKEYFGQETFFEGKAPLPEWAGYLIVIGFGAFFSLFTWAIMCTYNLLSPERNAYCTLSPSPHPHRETSRLITSYPPEHIYGERWL